MPDLKTQIVERMSKATPRAVWTPVDFFDLGTRDAVDKVLQRLVNAGDLRRIDRGLYDNSPSTAWLVSPARSIRGK